MAGACFAKASTSSPCNEVTCKNGEFDFEPGFSKERVDLRDLRLPVLFFVFSNMKIFADNSSQHNEKSLPSFI